MQSLTKLDRWQIQSGRKYLIEAELIAYAKPIYQVLDLALESRTTPERTRNPKSPRHREEISDAERQQIVDGLRTLHQKLARQNTH